MNYYWFEEFLIYYPSSWDSQEDVSKNIPEVRPIEFNF